MIGRPHSIVLDSEALSALGSGDKAMAPWLHATVSSRSRLFVSAATLAEVTDGTARDAGVRRIVRSMVSVEPVSEQIGYLAGALRASAAGTRRKPRDLTVDAIVAATAATLPSPVIVLTSDKPDLDLLLGETRVKVRDLEHN